MHAIKVWLEKFFKVHGAIFVGVYIGSFFLLITLQKTFNFDAFPGDILFEIERLNTTIYIPFTGALAFAIFFTLIFKVYGALKNP